MVVFINTKLKSLISLFKKKAVSNLDEESKWTVHYTAAWHQQENVFLPSSRPPCVEDLHREAKINLKTVLRECDKLRRDGYRSSQYYSQGPTFSSSPNMVCSHNPEDEEEHDRKLSVSSSEEERLLSGKKPKSPVLHEFSDTHTNWTKSLPLPTPEEKMRQEAQAIQTDVIPINVSGENFDRQANLRRSLIHTDTVVRRPKKVKRRQTITGVPDNIQKELAGAGQVEFRGHSLHIPDDYNPLERCQHSTPRIDTRDFSCQTEDIKVVPPSVRRIRAQKGQGIAALMSSSSGNMSTLSDPAGCSSRLNGNLNFRSLPRTGPRVCLHSLEQRTEDVGETQDTFITLPRQLNKLQVDDSVVHLRNNPRSGSLQRPKSQEVRSSQSEMLSNPASVVSPHAAYSTSVIPNAMLSSSSEVIAIHTSQSTGHLDNKGLNHGSSTHSKNVCHHHTLTVRGSIRHSQSTGPTLPSAITTISISDSTMSHNSNANNGRQGMSYARMNEGFDSDTHSESSCSEGRQRNGSITSSINSVEHWSYDRGESDRGGSLIKQSSAISGSPLSNMSTCSSEQKPDSGSLHSVDHEGYYTSMRVDSGISSGNQNKNVHNPRHSVINMFERGSGTMDGRSNYSDKSLTRSISLKKPKIPPPPPSRTDSLRRPPKKHIQSNGQVLNETLIASLQQSLQLNLKNKTNSSPSQSPCSDYEDPWVLRSRSQSTVSASSCGMSAAVTNLYSICAVTPSQSETSSIKSEYADQWSYFTDYAQAHDEQSKSPAMHSPSKSSRLNDYNTCELNYAVRSSIPQVQSDITKPNGASPEKSCRVTSPSSGYSSQSNTPTTLTPVPTQFKNASPANRKTKTKPKVPERRSSLISSVSISSSSTSLSSNTSDSLQQSMKMSNIMLPPTLSPPTPPLTPEPPLPPAVAVADVYNLQSSPKFPPPPPEAMFPSTPEGNLCLPPPPPPSSLVPTVNTRVFNKKIDATQRRNDNQKMYNSNKQELSRPAVPLVTADVLQMVQLKSVKKASNLENKKSVEQTPETKLCDESSFFSQPSLVPSASFDLESSLCFRENKNHSTPDEELQRSNNQRKKAELTSVVSTEKPLLTYREDAEQTSAHNGDPNTSKISLPQDKPSTSQSTKNESPNKKPPPVSKKPKLFIVPPPQFDLAAEKINQVNENVKTMPTASERESVSEHCEEVNGQKVAGNHSEETVDLTSYPRETGLFSSEFREEKTFFETPSVLEEMQNQEDEGEQSTVSDGFDTPDGKSKRTIFGHNLLTEQESGDVFEADIISSPLLISNWIEKNEELLTPTKSRTTEDLFAVIHRSKRKVLGRKDSDDDPRRNSSPPVTPTGGVPNVSTFKQAGSIQRSVRKSSTSSDNFKALLLKKGSRSECGSRMSAAEKLKHTDPRFQRSNSVSNLELPESPTFNSPNKNRAQEEWAKSEGLMPRSMSVSGTRYSRSRTPPSAASSKYNVRSRLQSSPMTVICEGEGEVADIVQGSFSKTPLMCTKSLDRFYKTDFDINDSMESEENHGKVHMNLMNKLSEVEDSDSFKS
uniref:NHS like 1 n=1 Tax=Leptobrachium leishanense TaxID=445787 RepID=A0A8C5WGH7_9ANUR